MMNKINKRGDFWSNTCKDPISQQPEFSLAVLFFSSFNSVPIRILTGPRNNVGLVKAFHAFSVKHVAF